MSMPRCARLSPDSHPIACRSAMAKCPGVDCRTDAAEPHVVASSDEGKGKERRKPSACRPPFSTSSKMRLRMTNGGLRFPFGPHRVPLGQPPALHTSRSRTNTLIVKIWYTMKRHRMFIKLSPVVLRTTSCSRDCAISAPFFSTRSILSVLT
ncbi:hypothetical protein BC628DRAFT_947307 [Trametes gibbosa]|nr:hypothetical protein BC628DRAFT_947307 [Trametes gibbosa]